jgi:hypothetical protein
MDGACAGFAITQRNIQICKQVTPTGQEACEDDGARIQIFVGLAKACFFQPRAQSQATAAQPLPNLVSITRVRKGHNNASGLGR